MSTSTTIPPGIEGELQFFTSGGHVADWMHFTKRKYYTNAFIVRNGKILLGYKKRGFGKHMYNGFGGKVEDGETPLQAAVRELEEEAGISAPLQHAGSLLFLNEGADAAFQIEIYRADEYSGDITETDEMRPRWFSLEPMDSKSDSPGIPYDQMWDDDRYWMPLLLAKQPFVGRADFKQEGDKFLARKWWFGILSESKPPQ